MAAAAPEALEERLRALDERVRSLRAAFQSDDERKIKVNTDINTLKVWMNRAKPQIGVLETLDLQGLEDRVRASVGEFAQAQAERLRGEAAEYTQAQVDRLKEETESHVEAALAAQGTQLTERLHAEQEALRGEFEGAREEWRAGLESVDAQLSQASSQERLDGLDFEVHQLRSSLADEVAAREQDSATLLATLTGALAAAKEDGGGRGAQERDQSADVLLRLGQAEKKAEGAATALDARLVQVEATLLDVVVHGSRLSPPDEPVESWALEALRGSVAELKAELEVVVHGSRTLSPDAAVEESLEALRGGVAELKAELEVVRLDRSSSDALLSPQSVTEAPPVNLTLEDADGQAWSFDAVGDFLVYAARRLKEFQQAMDVEAAARVELEQRLLLDRSQRQATRELHEEQRRQAHQQSQQVVVKRVEEMNASIAASLTSKSDKEDFIYINGEVLEVKNDLRQLEHRIQAVQAEALRQGPPCSTLQSEDGGGVGGSGEMKLIEDLQAQSVRLQTLARECHLTNSHVQPETKQAPVASPPPVELYAPPVARDASAEQQTPVSFKALPAVAASLSSPQPLCRPTREPSPIAVREARAVPVQGLTPVAARVPSQRELWQLSPSGISPRIGLAMPSLAGSCRSPSRDSSPVARRQRPQLSPPLVVRGLLGAAPGPAPAWATAGSGTFPAAGPSDGLGHLAVSGRQWHYQPEGPGGERLTR